VAGTVFDGQTTLKLGTGCEDSKEYEQITLREYLSYPMFSVVTPRMWIRFTMPYIHTPDSRIT
jgi:hypothetical protein